MIPAPLVWMNGFPGCGKLTVARVLVELLGTDNAVLIDNHQLIDPVEARMPRDHTDYQKERQLQRTIAFTEYVDNAALRSRIIIFTDFQSNNELGRSVAMEYKTAALSSGRPFLPIYLDCDVDENLQRVTSLERVDSGTTKLISCDVLKDLRSRCELFSFDAPERLRVDVTNLPPREAAMRILGHIKSGVQKDELSFQQGGTPASGS